MGRKRRKRKRKRKARKQAKSQDEVLLDEMLAFVGEHLEDPEAEKRPPTDPVMVMALLVFFAAIFLVTAPGYVYAMQHVFQDRRLKPTWFGVFLATTLVGFPALLSGSGLWQCIKVLRNPPKVGDPAPSVFPRATWVLVLAFLLLVDGLLLYLLVREYARGNERTDMIYPMLFLFFLTTMASVNAFPKADSEAIQRPSD